MSLCDEIRWDATLPEGYPPDDRLFQTKSLDYSSWDYYAFTSDGRLLLVGNGWDDDAGLSAETDISRAIEVEFHGDMLLSAMTKGVGQYVARFTHGRLEWIRPLAEGEPSSAVGAAHVKYFQARSNAKIEQPERGEGIPEEQLDEHKLKTE